MTLIQLECFLRAAETGSFATAAEQLFVSRQVVSAHVKALEEELGFALFHRGGKSIALTASGEVMFRELSSLRQRFGDAVRLAAAQNEEDQEISIGICEMNKDWYPGLYAFSQQHPNCKLNVETLPLRDLEKGLAYDRFDLVLSLNDALPPDTNNNYILEPLDPLQLVIVLSKDHPLAQRETLDFPDLQNECLYMVNADYSIQAGQNTLGHFRKIGCNPASVREFPNYKSLELALTNGGVCVVFDIFLENRGGRLKMYPATAFSDIHFMLAYKQDSSPLVKELAQFLKQGAQ